MDRNENGLPKQSAQSGRNCQGELRSGETSMNGGCGAVGREVMCVDCLDTKPLAHSYNPIQRWQMLYTVDKALDRGTLFEELDKPLGVYGNE